MPRSAIDATRFTATGPHAHSKSSVSSTTTAPPSSAPPRETPREKVNRLRNAARQARLDKESKFDRVVAIGRVWADRAHRFTALTLIAATGVATVVAIYGLGGMMIYNRRQRRDFFKEQGVLHAKALIAARQAASQGTADEDQILLLNRERAAQEAEEARLAKKGMWRRTKDWLYSGLKTEEEGSTTSGGTLAAVGDEVWKENATESNDGTGAKLGILKALKEKRREGIEPGTVEESTPAPPPKGGPLDRLANGESPTTQGGWTSLGTRR
ncbi:MAG: hypothetical protein M1812_003272 [Candelaria pacifica]|nr:MAG: hypothetical protein M1812_003272 [Candelaria pacifica]